MVGSTRLCLVASSLAMWTIATPAAASTITYQWRGIIDELFGNPGHTVGEKIKISLTVDAGIPDSNPSPQTGGYEGTTFGPPFPPPVVLAVDIGGATDTGSFQGIGVFNDVNGVDEFSVDVNSPMIGNVFTFDFRTSNLGALTSDALPLSLDPRNFDTATFKVYGEGPPGFSGRILSSLPGTVPLPDSAVMLVSALAGLAGAVWYKSGRIGI